MRAANGMMKNVGAVVVSSLLLGAVATPARAIPLLSGYEGLPNADGTFGQFAMPPNDDGSSNELTLPFAANFFGTTFNSFFVNNNGNVTFNGPVSTFTPDPFPVSGQPMIAPYWGDVDTSDNPGDGSNRVYVAAPNAETAVVTWDRVGFYDANNTRRNSFQLVLRDRSMEPGNVAGDFDIDFRYEQLQWTTGEASGGDINGLGGTEAQAGFDAGDRTNFRTLPGSRTPDVLNLQNTSNVSVATPGLWSFAVRNGVLPGSSPSNPLTPVIVDGSFVFDFNVNLDQQVWIDPDFAVGYDYEIVSGPMGGFFASVMIPGALPNGDDTFELLFDDINGNQQMFSLMAGVEFMFDPNDEVSLFTIQGIDISELLDPADGLAFVTGLTFGGFTGIQDFRVTQTPITQFVEIEGGAVPEPLTATLGLLGLGVLGMATRRRVA